MIARLYRVDTDSSTRPRSFTSLEAALGYAVSETIRGPVGYHVVLSKRTPDPSKLLPGGQVFAPLFAFDRIPAGRVLVKFLSQHLNPLSGVLIEPHAKPPSSG